MAESALTIASIIAGLFGGTGAVLVWELFLRPMVQGRAIAEVLSAEVSSNLEYLAAASLVARPNSIPKDFSLSTVVFESVTDRIGELPPNLVGEIVFLYRYFVELNKLPEAYGGTLKEYRSYHPGSSNYQVSQQELSASVAVFNQNVHKAIARIQLVQPLLLQAASPWWSLRARRRRKPIELDVDALKQRMEKSMRERQFLQATLTSQQDKSSE